MHGVHIGYPICLDIQTVILSVMQHWPIFLSLCILHHSRSSTAQQQTVQFHWYSHNALSV